ncbi:MAG: selenium-dependent xanthine dehydrogenase, partial [Clostridiales bacterium]
MIAIYTMTINGRPIVVAENCSLLYLLREQLNLTSVKNGCSEGACGACMVLVEGQARRACLLTVAKLAGKQVVTVEGLSDREKQVYAYAFSAVGAVQCGFCTPGMVISAKALLDQNPHPDMAAVRRSIRPNLCRCTGYKKIEQAILLAARLLRDSTPLPILSEEARLDAAAKVLGQAEYSDDLRLPGLLHGSALRSPYPHGRLMGLELTAARALPGVKAVLSASDVPGQLCIGHLRKDYPVLIPVGGEIRFLGDAIAVVAAESREIAEQAKALIRADYQILPGIFSPAESMAKDAPQLSGEGNLLAETRLRRGDAAAAIAQAPFAVCNTYHLPMTEQAFLEPETAVAVRQGQQLWIYSGDQDIYQTRRECSEMLGLPGEQVRVIAKTVGGAFGGKEDMSVQHHAALLAWYTKQPVKVSLTRDESLQIHPKRHAMEITVTTACEADGLLTAVQMEILADAGAYASLSGPVLQRACTHGAGPYRCANIDIHGCAWLTNNPPGGAFRGFGVSQSCFAGEANLNLLAAQVGISPWEIRAKNGIRPGDLLPNGQIAAADTAYLETLAAVKPFYLSHPGAGIASAVKNSG